MGAASSINCFEQGPLFSADGNADAMMFLCRSELPMETHHLCDYEEKMCKIMVADEKGRRLFAKYIKLGTWMRKFKASPEYGVIMMLASQVQADVKIVPEFPATSVQFESNYMSPRRENSESTTIDLPSRSVSNTSGFEMNREDSTDSGITTIHGSGYSQLREDIIKQSFTIKELLSLMFVALYPLFLESTMHRQSQKSGLKKMSSSKDPGYDSSDYYSNSDEENNREGTGHALNLLLKAATYYDEDNLVSILSTPHWMVNYLPSRMIDQAPISISIASADGVRGFPIVYVNRAFEKLTGYTMKDIYGKSHRILQGVESNTSQILRMREALEEQRAVKVELNNYTKQGRRFKNLVILTPVFDRMGIFSYVIGVQFDITDYMLTQKDVQIVEDVLSLLPYILNR